MSTMHEPETLTDIRSRIDARNAERDAILKWLRGQVHSFNCADHPGSAIWAEVTAWLADELEKNAHRK